VQRLQSHESERGRLQADLRRLEIVAQTHTLDARKISEDLESRLADWRGLLRANVQEARRMLRRLMLGRLVVGPNSDSTIFTITGTGLLEPLLEQVLSVPKEVVTSAGGIRTRTRS
jgi:hypothetical protein